MAAYDESSPKVVLSWKLRRFLHKKTDAAGTAENLRDLLLDWIDDVEVDPPAPPGTSTATPTKTERKRKAPEKSEKEIHQQKLQENMAEIKAMDARFQVTPVPRRRLLHRLACRCQKFQSKFVYIHPKPLCYSAVPAEPAQRSDGSRV